MYFTSMSYFNYVSLYCSPVEAIVCYNNIITSVRKLSRFYRHIPRIILFLICESLRNSS